MYISRDITFHKYIFPFRSNSDSKSSKSLSQSTPTTIESLICFQFPQRVQQLQPVSSTKSPSYVQQQVSYQLQPVSTTNSSNTLTSSHVPLSPSITITPSHLSLSSQSHSSSTFSPSSQTAPTFSHELFEYIDTSQLSSPIRLHHMVTRAQNHISKPKTYIDGTVCYPLP